MDHPHLNPTEQKLLTAFMHFKKAEWHQRSVAGYKPSEIRVLLCIHKGAKHALTDMKVSDISRFLHVTAPTVTQLIKGLEANGLIQREVDPSDRRAVCIRLTDKGEVVVQKAQDDFSVSFRGLIEHLGEEQSNLIAELLTKVYIYFNEKEASSEQSQWSGDEET